MEWVKLGDVAEIKKGKKVDECQASVNTVRYIQIEDLRHNDVMKFTCAPKAVMANSEDVLIAWDGANAGTVSFDLEGAIGSTISKITIKKNKKRELLPQFLGIFLQSKEGYLRQTATGATIPHINKQALQQLAVPLFTLEIQNRIINLNKNLGRLIAKRREQIDALDALVSGLFYGMFQYYLENKEKNVKLSDITSHISSGSTPRGGREVYTSDGIPFIRSQDVLMNHLDLSQVAYIPLQVHESMKRSTLHYKDVLINITGASIGRTAVFYGETGSANTNQHVASIRLKGNVITSEFLSYYFSTEYFQKVIQKVSSGGTREALNYQQIGEFRIPEAPISKQEMFVRIKNSIEAQKESLRASLSELETLFDALMQEAFSGHLN